MSLGACCFLRRGGGDLEEMGGELRLGYNIKEKNKKRNRGKQNSENIGRVRQYDRM